MLAHENVALPSSSDALALMPASDLVDLLRKRKIGAEELLTLFLERTDRINSSINAIVVLDAERALQAAREADRLLTRKDSGGALLGLPMTVKETFEVTGLATTCGLPMLAQHVSQQDAVAVERLRREGAIIFGKTNVPTGGADHQSNNPLYGMTRNPWSLDRTPGGSSGGAAAALAAGLTPLELGSDIGGSIRIPAHFCGVCGHKSSYGIVPTRGHVPPMPGQLTEPDLAVAGPLARSPRDLEMMLDIIAGPVREAATAWSFKLPPSRHAGIGDFRVAIWSELMPYAASAETVAALKTLAGDLRKVGAKVSESARPNIDAGESFDTYLRTLFSIVLGGRPFSVTAAEVAKMPPDALPYLRIMQESAARSFADWSGLAEQRANLGARWRTFFEHWDVLVCPVFPTTAFPHDLSGGDELTAQLHRRRSVDGEDISYLAQLAWPSLATVADLPSTVVPMPRNPGELPLGVQIIGPPLEDKTALRFACELERKLGRTLVPPAISRSARLA